MTTEVDTLQREVQPVIYTEQIIGAKKKWCCNAVVYIMHWCSEALRYLFTLMGDHPRLLAWHVSVASKVFPLPQVCAIPRFPHEHSYSPRIFTTTMIGRTSSPLSPMVHSVES